MMQDYLPEVARLQPFEPFCIHLTTGATSAIRHSDFIMVGRRATIIGITNESGDTAFDRAFNVDLLPIVNIEGLPDPVARRTCRLAGAVSSFFQDNRNISVPHPDKSRKEQEGLLTVLVRAVPRWPWLTHFLRGEKRSRIPEREARPILGWRSRMF